MVPSANVFVVGLDEGNLRTLESLPQASEMHFHQLLHRDDLLNLEDLDLPARIAEAERILDDFDGSVDAVVGYWDFPVSSIVPILCQRFDLVGPGLDGVVRAEHKYWSRLEQAEVIDDYPAFALVPLDDESPELPEGVPFPMWLKPVKGVSSQLAFRVDDEEGFRRAVREIREGIDAFSDPFDVILDRVELPPEIEAVRGRAALAEETATGRQFTVEGYCLDDVPHVYGVVETVLYPGRSSFHHYEYPAQLPQEAHDRMVRASERVMRRLRLGSGTFNIEYFWDEESDRVQLLEVNARHSQAHAEIFRAVDGVPNHHVMVEIGLGRDPQMPHRQGEYAVAGKFFLRAFVDDAVVTGAPSADDVARVQREIAGVVSIASEVTPGMRLSELDHQDPYSYVLADIVIGADDADQLRARYEACIDALGYVAEASPLGETGGEEDDRA